MNGAEPSAGDFAAGAAATGRRRSSLTGTLTLRPADFASGGTLELTVPTYDDAESELPEHFAVALAPVAGEPVRVQSSAGRSPAVTIEDNDAFTVGLGAPSTATRVEGAPPSPSRCASGGSSPPPRPAPSG